MKKAILAAAVSVAAGSASAATIYEGNGLTYKLNGDLQVQFRQDVGDDQHADIEFDDLELKNYVSYDLGNNMKAFGRVDFGFKDAAEDKQNGSDLEEAYVGLDFGTTAVRFGKMDFATEEFGVEKAYELVSDEDQFDALGDDGDDVIRVDVELDHVFFAVSYELEAENEDSQNGEYLDLFIEGELGAVTLAAAYKDFEEENNGESVDVWGLSATFDAGFAEFAADYTTSDSDDDTSANNADQYNIAASFKAADTTKIAIGMVDTDYDVAAEEDFTEWYANVTYKFPAQKNVSLFAEIADTDQDDSDMGYLAGMRVKF